MRAGFGSAQIFLIAAFAGLMGSSAPAQNIPEQSTFYKCLASLWPEASERRIARSLFDAHTVGITPISDLLSFADSQPEFAMTARDYLASVVSEDRVNLGKQRLGNFAGVFD